MTRRVKAQGLAFVLTLAVGSVFLPLPFGDLRSDAGTVSLTRSQGEVARVVEWAECC